MSILDIPPVPNLGAANPVTFITYANPGGDPYSAVTASGYFNPLLTNSPVQMATGDIIFDQYNNIFLVATVTGSTVTVASTNLTLNIGNTGQFKINTASGFMIINALSASPGITALQFTTGGGNFALAGDATRSFFSAPVATGTATFRLGFNVVGASNPGVTAGIGGGVIKNTGWRIGSEASPTAFLHIAAGRAVAGAAPLKFDTGTNLTTPEAGALEFDGTKFSLTASTTREDILTSTMANNAAALVATLTNSPVTGNPTKWVPINDRGTTRYMPLW